MGSYRIPFKKTSKISKEFWHYQVRTNRIIGKHSWLYTTTTQQIFQGFSRSQGNQIYGQE